MAKRKFTFSLLVHSDSSSPLIDFSAKSSILQVRRRLALRARGVQGTTRAPIFTVGRPARSVWVCVGAAGCLMLW